VKGVAVEQESGHVVLDVIRIFMAG
jgi:hypothetical protein